MSLLSYAAPSSRSTLAASERTTAATSAQTPQHIPGNVPQAHFGHSATPAIKHPAADILRKFLQQDPAPFCRGWCTRHAALTPLGYSYSSTLCRVFLISHPIPACCNVLLLLLVEVCVLNILLKRYTATANLATFMIQIHLLKRPVAPSRRVRFTYVYIRWVYPTRCLTPRSLSYSATLVKQ